MGAHGRDLARISASEREFWRALWETPVIDAIYERGIDSARFGPVLAACITSEATDTGVNFILGGGEAGAVEHGHLADAAAWLESRCLEHDGRVGVDYRVPVVPGLPDSAAAEDCLRAWGVQREEGSTRLVRDTSAPPSAKKPPRVEVLDWNEWDDGFSGPLAESLGLPGFAEVFFYSLLERESDVWNCYGAIGEDRPLAYAVMHRDSGVATLVLGSRPAEGHEGEGQVALLQRCIADAAQAGCDMIMIANAGQEPPGADRESMVRVGFESVFRAPTWTSRAEVGAKA